MAGCPIQGARIAPLVFISEGKHFFRLLKLLPFLPTFSLSHESEKDGIIIIALMYDFNIKLERPRSQQSGPFL
jgi:hypothetical protein